MCFEPRCSISTIENHIFTKPNIVFVSAEQWMCQKSQLWLNGKSFLLPFILHLLKPGMSQAIHFTFSPICSSDRSYWSLAEGKWRNRGKKQMIKSEGDSYVVSLNRRFIPVLLLWLQCSRGNGRQSVNPITEHLVILSSYLVVKVKCVIGLVAPQQARLKGSIKTGTSRVSTAYVLIKAEISYSVQ